MQKAIELYNKGGNTPYALELCFRMDEFTSLPGAGYGNQSTSKSSVEVFEMINSIAANLDTKTSPKVLQRCAEFLIGHKQFERAMELYVIAKKFAEAIEVCAKYKITITESSLGRLVPDEGGAGIDAVQRKEILSLLAATLRDQACLNVSENVPCTSTEFFRHCGGNFPTSALLNFLLLVFLLPGLLRVGIENIHANRFVMFECVAEIH